MSRTFMPEVKSQSELEELQLAGLKWTVKHAYEGSKDYRKKMDEAGVRPEDIQNLSDLQKLPFTTAKDLQDGYPYPLLAVPLKDDHDVFLGVVLVARDVSQLEALKQKGNLVRLHRICGSSQVMQTVYSLIENVGKVDTTVLIMGESGTGKELVAEALHAESPRRDMPLVKVDCTAISETLLESELFGHKKGSFTGAVNDKKGLFEEADGGTVFLDEISNISFNIQIKLLRLIQEGEFKRVGENNIRKANVRLIVASNKPLSELVEEGKFRKDLYYRLSVFPIKLPPLREREGDITLLAFYFLNYLLDTRESS